MYYPLIFVTMYCVFYCIAGWCKESGNFCDGPWICGSVPGNGSLELQLSHNTMAY